MEYKSDVDVPVPKEDEVLINVKGAGINNTDINTRIGWYSKSSVENTDDGSWSGNPLNFPIIQGADICGYIERNEIRPLVANTYPLKNIKKAQEDFLTKKYIGKLVLIPPNDIV